MIILVVIINAKVKKVFIDLGSSANIIFRDAFNKLGLKNSNLQTYKKELIGFSSKKVHPDGYMTLHTLGTRPKTRTVKVNLLVVDYPSTYNVILGRLSLNKIGAIISTICLTMKFFIYNEEIATVKADQAELADATTLV